MKSLEFLNEITKLKTQTKEKTKYDDTIFQSKKDSLPGVKQKSTLRDKPDVNLHITDKETTKAKTASVAMDEKSLEYFLNMNFDDLDIDDIENGDIDITVPTPENLPAVISTSLRAAGMVTPEFHMVKHLPGYMSAGIRAIGRQVFSPFTKTPIEQISVIANLNNSGPNDASELRAVAGFLHKHGTRNSQVEMEFQEVIPGYKADVVFYSYANYAFLVVRDHAGHYIYSWPATDMKTKIEDKSMDVISESLDMLLEAATNIINGGSTTIPIVNAKGEVVDELQSFQKIMQTMLKIVKQYARNPEVAKWFEGNFVNWFKKGAEGYDNFEPLMPTAKFYEFFFPSLEDIVEIYVAEEGIDRDEFINSLPEYARKDIKSFQVFAGGRIHRFNRMKKMIELLSDYLNAVVDNSTNRNEVILPDVYFVKDISKLLPTIAWDKSVQWHLYTERMAEKISLEKAKSMLDSLRNGIDYKILDDDYETGYMVQLLTAKAAETEGVVMKHCVGSYGKAVANGSEIIYSFRNKEGLPQCTIQLSQNKRNALQVKGPHNSTVRHDYHRDITKFLIKNNIEPGHDARFIEYSKYEKELRPKKDVA